MTAVAPPTVEVRRLLAGAGQRSLAEHLRVHPALPAGGRHDARRLLAALAGAPLPGRGGAGFPAARKLAAAGARGQLIANCSEGEPASRKDAALLGHAPHLVLDGAQLAARAIRAREVVVAVHAGPVSAVVARAVEERRGYDGVRTRLLEVPARYVAGEASALARAAGGGPALPALHDQPLAVRGLDGRSQVVLNAETLAGLALYLGHGPAWYGQVGTVDEPGTLLLTVQGDTVLEVPVGTSVGAALAAAGVDAAGLQAVLVGGYFGAWLAAPEVLDVPLSHAGLRQAGGSLGAGVVVALTAEQCGLRATAQVVRYLAAQSARQCGPCLNGLPALADALDALAAGRARPAVLDRLAALCGLVTGRGLCAHPDGTAALVHSALVVFAENVPAHLSGGCDRPAGPALAVP